MTARNEGSGQTAETLTETPGIEVGCSCAVVKDHDNDIIKEYFKCKKWTNKNPDPS